MSTLLQLHIEGDEVTLLGTVKGDETHRALVPRPWVWSRSAGGYVLPRNLLPLTRTRHIAWLRERAKQAGLPLEEHDIGEVLSEQERRDRRTQRLEDRADRHQHVAERAAADAAHHEAASRRVADGYPLGQPLLVGHHSEKRHRRDLDRMHRHDERWSEANRTAQERARLAAGIRRALEKGDPPVTIRLRIERHQADIRRIERTLQRFPDDVPLVAERARLIEAVEIDQCVLIEMEDAGRTVTYGPHNVQKGGWVQLYVDGGWHPVRRVNKTSVTVPNGIQPQPECNEEWTTTVKYAKILGYRPPQIGSKSG